MNLTMELHWRNALKFVRVNVFGISRLNDCTLKYLQPASITRMVMDWWLASRRPAQENQSECFAICGNKISCIILLIIKKCIPLPTTLFWKSQSTKRAILHFINYSVLFWQDKHYKKHSHLNSASTLSLCLAARCLLLSSELSTCVESKFVNSLENCSKFKVLLVMSLEAVPSLWFHDRQVKLLRGFKRSNAATSIMVSKF